MRNLTPEEIRAFLIDTPRIATLATVRADGSPHVATIWFDLDGDVIVFTTWHTTVKAVNMHRDARVALCVDDEKPPYTYVIVEGTTEFVDDLVELRRWAARIAGRYMGVDRAEEFGARNGVPGEQLMRLTPTKIVAKTGITD